MEMVTVRGMSIFRILGDTSVNLTLKVMGDKSRVCPRSPIEWGGIVLPPRLCNSTNVGGAPLVCPPILGPFWVGPPFFPSVPGKVEPGHL